MMVKRSPLEAKSIGHANTVVLRELADIHNIDLRVAPGTASHAAVCTALGIDLPGKTGQSFSGTVAGAAAAHVLSLAPDWWLIVGAPQAEPKLASLREDESLHFSVVDVSGQRTTIELEGPHASEMLAHVWEQDLRDKSFPVGAVSQGLIAHAPVIVFHAAPQQYRVMVRSSFAIHAWQILADAAVEYTL